MNIVWLGIAVVVLVFAFRLTYNAGYTDGYDRAKWLYDPKDLNDELI